MRFHIRHALFGSMIILAGCASHDQSAQQAAEFSRIIAEGDANHPILPDDVLISAFQQHHSTFEELRQMIATDSKLHRVDEDWTDPKDPAEVGISPERIAEYRRLLAEVGCSRGFIAYPTRPGIYFISGARGLVVAGSTKGYCCLESALPLVVTNTETYSPPHAGDDFEVFRPIEGHWYIWYECH